MKITIQTMSTKCQYSPTSSTASDCCGPIVPANDRVNSVSSISTPTATWAPWNPVSTKNEEPNRFVDSVSPSRTNSVNS